MIFGVLNPEKISQQIYSLHLSDVATLPWEIHSHFNGIKEFVCINRVNNFSVDY